jgi:hypothetical protein
MSALVSASAVAITFSWRPGIGLALLYAFGRSQPYCGLLERCWGRDGVLVGTFAANLASSK